MAPYLGEKHDGLLWLLAAVSLLGCDGAVVCDGDDPVSRLAAAACRGKDDISRCRLLLPSLGQVVTHVGQLTKLALLALL